MTKLAIFVHGEAFEVGLHALGVCIDKRLIVHTHRRTGRCGVLAIATWAAWFRAAQGRLLTNKKEERKGKKKKKERRRKKRKGKKEKRRKGRRLETDMGRLFRV